MFATAVAAAMADAGDRIALVFRSRHGDFCAAVPVVELPVLLDRLISCLAIPSGQPSKSGGRYQAIDVRRDHWHGAFFSSGMPRRVGSRIIITFVNGRGVERACAIDEAVAQRLESQLTALVVRH